MVRMLISALLVTTFATWAQAEAPRFPEPGLDQAVGRLVEVIDRLGQAKLPEAIDALAPTMSRPLSPTDRDRFLLTLAVFNREPARFESVECTAIQRYSSQACEVVLVAHGQGGPIEFRFRLYFYESRWRTMNIGFKSNWESFLQPTAEQRLSPPMRYPLVRSET